MLIINTEAIEAVNQGREIPGYIKIGANRVARIKYQSTSGWRGYKEA